MSQMTKQEFIKKLDIQRDGGGNLYIAGSVWGDIHGNVCGSVHKNVFGSVHGNVWDKVLGKIGRGRNSTAHHSKQEDSDD